MIKPPTVPISPLSDYFPPLTSSPLLTYSLNLTSTIIYLNIREAVFTNLEWNNTENVYSNGVHTVCCFFAAFMHQ